MVQVVPYFLIVKSSIACLAMSPPLRKCKSVYSQMRRYMVIWVAVYEYNL